VHNENGLGKGGGKPTGSLKKDGNDGEKKKTVTGGWTNRKGSCGKKEKGL